MQIVTLFLPLQTAASNKNIQQEKTGLGTLISGFWFCFCLFCIFFVFLHNSQNLFHIKIIYYFMKVLPKKHFEVFFASSVWSRDQPKCHILCFGENETSALAKPSVYSLWGYGLMALLVVAAHWILVLHCVAWGYFLISSLFSILSLVFIPTQLLFTQGCEHVAVYNECLGRWSHTSILTWNHLESLILNSLLATSLVVLTPLSSVLALSGKKKPKHKKTNSFHCLLYSSLTFLSSCFPKQLWVFIQHLNGFLF